jgi:hypothetical protein
LRQRRGYGIEHLSEVPFYRGRCFERRAPTSQKPPIEMTRANTADCPHAAFD